MTGRPPLHQRHVAARPADVDGQRVREAGLLRRVDPADHARRRPGQHRRDGPRAHDAGAGDRPARLHHLERRVDPGRRSSPPSSLQVPLDHRAGCRRRTRSSPAARTRGTCRRPRTTSETGASGYELVDELAGAQLVARIEVAEQVADDERRHAVPLDAGRSTSRSTAASSSGVSTWPALSEPLAECRDPPARRQEQRLLRADRRGCTCSDRFVRGRSSARPRSRPSSARPSVAPSCSSTAFVPMVVPWTTRSTSPGRGAALVEHPANPGAGSPSPRCGRRRRHLGDVERRRSRLVRHDVGEGAADVDPEGQPRHRHVPSA